MTTDEESVLLRDADLDLYAIGANIPGGSGVVWVTTIDHSDGVFAGQWVDEERVSRTCDGDVYIRLRRVDGGLVDAELVLAHDGRLVPVVRLLGVEDWAEQLRTPTAAVAGLHADLESGEPCKSYADGAAPV
jgi:hypothetical protein